MDMFFTQRKLEGRIRELGEYRYRDVRNFESFLAKEDKSGLVKYVDKKLNICYNYCERMGGS